MEIHDDMKLYTSAEKFYIGAKSAKELLIIDRISEAVYLEKKDNQQANHPHIDFCGFLGSITLIAGRYLVIATHRDLVGFVAGHAIWRLRGFKLVPYFKSTIHLSNLQQSDNATYLSMVEHVLNTPYFYFSYTYDLSHTMQRLNGAGPMMAQQSMLARADQRFVWNWHLLKGFQNPDFKNFTLPIIHGFISINQVVINGNTFNWIMISRRSTQRAGTRYFRRGTDRNGSVANFVETEQIVDFQGDQGSFVQIRGSIPLFWTQLPDLRYKPPPKLVEIDREDHNRACLRHLETTSQLYGRQILVNLVDQKGAEGKLEQAFGETVNNIRLSSVRYEPFDFHAECRHMRWDRLSILIDRLQFEQEEMGYFLMMRDGSLVSMQDGVFRTNCIDCLDRTNVVQSLLAHRSLTAMLKKLNILKPNENVENHGSFESLFKNVWADNADFISVQYSGTGALKTDYTRTGKRTKAGLLRDGVNSLTRYYKNNFTDGYRQDALDLFHGLADLRSPLTVDRGWRYITFPSVLLVAVAMFVTCAIIPPEYSTESLLFLLFWGSMVFATGHTILRYGHEFVDKPRLL
ncbi:phosphatidylinositol-3-phosphatase SAC1 [Onthophagus taurus]|uniref:phosphatidylinositol-3-phosphatase SAC1 n=1 Tax=Onthophagus taurus TaxID=166361 RepID=UPI000C209B42|nr:phosphatidylinositide phosphatase SAC1 [Onthophagus taurus]